VDILWSYSTLYCEIDDDIQPMCKRLPIRRPQCVLLIHLPAERRKFALAVDVVQSDGPLLMAKPVGVQEFGAQAAAVGDRRWKKLRTEM
jgi:hypothetical protein